MLKAIEDFRENISRVQHMGGLHKAMLSLMTGAVDTSDLLRAQIVLAVSALDCYIHEATTLGMVEIFDGKRAPTPAFQKFRVPINLVLGNGAIVSSSWFESEIRERHSFLTFQRPERIADAIRLFSEVSLWRKVGIKLSMSEKDVKDHLTLIVDRRNKIAHEADIAPGCPTVRWSISEHDVAVTLEFITKICEAIHDTVK
ncbi:MAG: HEPN domain-containing protein [Gallionella sp.]|nr:HEPN domain-containing protein [Gallionella sp.]